MRIKREDTYGGGFGVRILKTFHNNDGTINNEKFPEFWCINLQGSPREETIGEDLGVGFRVGGENKR